MRFAPILATFALLASSFAWKIPRNVEDGVYSVETLSDGSAVHTKIIDAADIDSAQPKTGHFTSISKSGTSLEERSSGKIWCGCGFTLDPGNCDAAVADLKSQLNFVLVHPGQAFFSVRGPVVAFACNRAQNGESWLVDPGTITRALGAVTNSCGRYIAGAEQIGDDNQVLLIGYQRWSANVDFCGNARSSPAHSC